MYYGITIFLYMLFFRECPIVVFFKDVGVLYIYIYICVCVYSKTGGYLYINCAYIYFTEAGQRCRAQFLESRSPAEFCSNTQTK